MAIKCCFRLPEVEALNRHDFVFDYFVYQLTKVRDRKYPLEENHIFLFVSRGLSYLRFGPSVFPFTLNSVRTSASRVLTGERA